MINWVFDLDLTLYEIHGNIFSYKNIIKPDKLRENLKKLIGRKVMFTNGNLEHSLTCINLLNLKYVFHKVLCRELTGYKPSINSYIKAYHLTGMKQDEKTFWKKIDEYYNWNENYKGMIVSKNHKNILKNYWYENIIKLIYSYDDNNIQKIKDLLIFYINAKYNPNLSFDEEVLKDLWFIVCNECTKEVH